MALLQGLLAGFGGGALVAALAWLLRAWIKTALQKDLTSHAERLKHGLQRELLKAELSTNKVHVVYPKVAAKLRKAEGAVGGLYGGRFAPTYEGYDRADFEEVIGRLNLPGAERARLISAIEDDRTEGIEELQKIVRRVETEGARRAIFAIKNLLILKSLFLSDAVRSGAFDAHKTLWETWVDIEITTHPGFRPAGNHYEKIQSGMSRASQQLEALEALMRRELQPKES